MSSSSAENEFMKKESEENLKNRRKTLQVLDTDKENLENVIDKQNPFKSGVNLNICNINSTELGNRKKMDGKAVGIRINAQHKTISGLLGEKRITEKDLTSTDGKVSEYYWEKLAEKRRGALEIALKENQQLHEHIQCLREELVTFQKLYEEAKGLISVLTEILNEDDSKDETEQKQTLVIYDEGSNSSAIVMSDLEE
uniref:Geminin n=1 Tax=Glossina morsitans morsitans TaxID=37546 RepID=A0A1B0G328_GLOMM